MRSPFPLAPVMRPSRLLLLMAAFCLLWPAGRAAARRLVINPNRIDALRKKPANQPALNLRHDLGSSRQILRSAWTGEPDSLTVLVIRIDFPPDTTSATTGTGQFLYDPSGPMADSPLFDTTFDYPPHDRYYFQRHVGALNNYCRAVSHDLLRVGGIVFPDADRGAYTVPHQMEWYSPDPDAAGPEQINGRLVEFFRDAVQAAAADPDLDFSQFDEDGDGRLDKDPVAVLIVHAGSDFQADQGDSPSDIRSAFIPSLDLPLYLGNEYRDGIPADGVLVTDGMIVPESAQQPETVGAGIEFGLNGVLAHEFGHQLGLPDFYFTSGLNPGVTAVGGFCLMDAGNFNGVELSGGPVLFGFLPAFPSAWCRRYLGWETEENERSLTVVSPDKFELKAAGLPDGLFSLKVPATSDEYFMVENRQSELNGDDLVIVDDSLGVWWSVDNNEYDAFLPGSGLLIWHVDETYLNPQTIEENRVNINPQTKEMGLALEEADGIEDLGRYLDYFGGPLEPFFAGNNDAFTPFTNPNSNSNGGASTGVSLFEISALDTLMTLRASFDVYQAGWPRTVSGTPGANGLLTADLDSDGAIDLIGLALEEGGIYLWDRVGEPFLADSDTALAFLIGTGARSTPSIWVDPQTGDSRIFVISGSSSLIALDLPADRKASKVHADTLDLPVPLRGVAVVGDSPDDGPILALSGGDFDGTVMLVDGSGKELPGWPREAGSAIHTSPLIVPAGRDHGPRVVSLAASGYLVAWDLEGNETARVDLGGEGGFVLDPVAGDLDRDGNYEVFAVSALGEMALADLASGSLEDGWPRDAGRAVLNPPVLVDADVDGYIEPLFLVEDSEALAYNRNGTLVSGYPLRLRAELDKGTGPPSLAQLDGAGPVDLVLGGPGGDIWAFGADGRALAGFPKSTGGVARTTPVLLDMDGDGDLEILAVTTEGIIYAWDQAAPATDAKLGWNMDRGDPGRANIRLIDDLPEPPAESDRLLSGFYNYPNPTRGNATTFRFRLAEPSDFNLDLFTLDGRRVLSEAGNGVGMEHNEIKVDLDRFPTGVYICRLEARARTGARQEVKFCKMAVTR